ncbi:hypothetical protein AV903_07980 [Erwinia tracheiphila]|uniref:Inverse autotransporter beta-domain domain-containing protein n=1 Tax=Erwinia tracheiphila TaxID=65700 RepID=A0A345CRD2_9GAMM|nr:hypothetical protein AV903_07980 [Erwinia tracheiphila]
MNYQIGVALSKQLSSDNVGTSRSLSGNRYDPVSQRDTPVMAFRQRKTLSVFFVSLPWQARPGEVLPLKVQVRNVNLIKAISWQGDTRALSLTSPANHASSQGWSTIIPQCDNSSDVTGEYHLSVTFEDSQRQCVSSNWITLKLSPPVVLESSDDNHFDLIAP